MTDSNTSKWNARYAYSGASLPPAARVLTSGARWLPDGDGLTALDLACGRAANAHWLANRGFIVSAWDISDKVIDEIRQRQPSLIHEACVRDVSADPPEPASFDVVVVADFLTVPCAPR